MGCGCDGDGHPLELSGGVLDAEHLDDEQPVQLARLLDPHRGVSRRRRREPDEVAPAQAERRTEGAARESAGLAAAHEALVHGEE